MRDAPDELRLLEVRQVRRVGDDLEPRGRDAVCDQAPVLGRRGGVLGAGDDERRGLHAGERAPEIHVGERLAAAGVPLRRRRQQVRGAPATTSGRARPNSGVNHRAKRTIDERLDPVRSHRACPIAVGALGVEVGGAAADDQPLDALGRVRQRPRCSSSRRSIRRIATRARSRAGRAARAGHRRGRRSHRARSGTGERPWPRRS